MQIERLAVALRPRSPWEAIDLGFRMARVWWRPLFAAWFAVTLPVALALACLLPSHPWFALLLLWWIKPLLERAPLYVVSRAVFGDVPGWRATLRALPREWRHGSLYSLTLHRPTRARSFTMPVIQLEGLRWGALSKRQQVLRRGALGVAWLFQFTCVLIEISIVISLYGLALLLVPTLEFSVMWESVRGDLVSPYHWLHYAFVVLAFSAVAPFYVAGGFGLYINRRMELEGWDIELVFRKLARRVTGDADPAATPPRRAAASVAAALLLSLAMGIGIAAEPASADEVLSASEARHVIDEIVKREMVTKWAPRQLGGRSEVRVPGVAWLAGGLRWVLLAGALIVLVVFLSKLQFRRRGAEPTDTPEAIPESVAGLDIRPESLPDDVVATARELWREGKRRDAMSLLYRGALAHLVNGHALRVPESATEGECVREVRHQHQGALVDDFAVLTGSWQRVAYAHEAPLDDTFSDLCRRWSEHLRGRPAVSSQ